MGSDQPLNHDTDPEGFAMLMRDRAGRDVSRLQLDQIISPVARSAHLDAVAEYYWAK